MRLTEQEYRENCDQYMGYCPTCDEFTREMTEPDAEGYKCPSCEGLAVVGADLALMNGSIELEEEEID